MNSKKYKPLSVQTLENISFERSKNWANFLNDLTLIKQEHEVLLNDMEDVYCNNEPSASSDESDSIEETDEMTELEEIGALRDITNRSCTFGSSIVGAVASVAQKSSNFSLLVHRGEISTVDMDEDVNLLNETLPVLAEHERKWKEEGLDKVLNSFDAQKIEEKVGGWLRRNHVGCVYHGATGQRGSRNAYIPKRFCAPVSYGVDTVGRRLSPVASETETESLHSVDTARYILASRKRHGATQRKSNSSTTTTTIKTFRMVQSKRDALRKKYACLEQNDDAHLNELRGRRTHTLRRRCHESRPTQRHMRCYPTNELRAIGGTQSAQFPPRRWKSSHQRKHLQKYHANSGANDTCSSSSDIVESDDEEWSSGGPTTSSGVLAKYRGTSRRRKSLKKRVHRRSVCYNHNTILDISVSSSTSSSYLSPLSSARSYNLRHRAQHDVSVDSSRSPHGRETSCKFRNEKFKVNSRHIPGDSSEKWIVKNCRNNMKAFIPQPPSNHKKESIQYDSTDAVPCASHGNPFRKDELVEARSQKKKDDKPLQKEKQKTKKKTASEKKKYKPNLQKEDKNKTKPDSDSHLMTDTMFERELQIALEESKKSYTAEKLKRSKVDQNEGDQSNEITKTINALKLYTPGKVIKEAESINELKKRKETITTAMQVLNTHTNVLKWPVSCNEMKKSKDTITTQMQAWNRNTRSNSTKKSVSCNEHEKSAEMISKPIQALQVSTPSQIIKKDTRYNEIKQSKPTITISKEAPNTPTNVFKKPVSSNEMKKPKETITTPMQVLSTPTNVFKKPISSNEMEKPKETITTAMQVLSTPTEVFKKPISYNEIKKSKEAITTPMPEVMLKTPTRESMTGSKVGNVTPAQFKKIQKPQPRSVRQRKMEKYFGKVIQEISDETFLNSTLSIRNSTALANDTARTRQMSGSTASTSAGAHIHKIPTVVSATETQSLNKITEAKEKAVSASVCTRIDSNTFSIAAASSLVSAQKCTSSAAVPMSHIIDSDSDSDSTIVSSTTGYHTQDFFESSKGILLYTPKNKTLAPADSFTNGHFKITEKHLSSVIGKKAAHKFLKYYMGRRCFDCSSTVYFRPPQGDSVLDRGDENDQRYVDDLELMSKYGELYETSEASL